MKAKKVTLRWRQLIPVEILVGILLMTVMFVIASNDDISTAEQELVSKVEYMKEQCNNSQLINLASEAKSLLRLTESAEQIRWRMKYGPELSRAATVDRRPGHPGQGQLSGRACSWLGRTARSRPSITA